VLTPPQNRRHARWTRRPNEGIDVKPSKAYVAPKRDFTVDILPWTDRLRRMSTKLLKRHKADLSYLRANCLSVQRAVDGMGPDSSKVIPGAGARMTVNMSSAHIPAFCEASRRHEKPAYKNCYDREGGTPGDAKAGPSASRLAVDRSLPGSDGDNYKQIYFGAIELGGAGVRFYGDVCLALKYEATEGSVILDRNSYDLVRAPVKDTIAHLGARQKEDARRLIARSWSGSWQKDLATIAAIKVLGALGTPERRWTTGQICSAVRNDEDYIEVLKRGSFAADNVQEARLSASDVAQDALTTSQLDKKYPVPRLEALIWTNRRNRAQAALRDLGVPVRVVGNSGRTKD
jgi:hypothetical protein